MVRLPGMEDLSGERAERGRDRTKKKKHRRDTSSPDYESPPNGSLVVGTFSSETTYLDTNTLRAKKKRDRQREEAKAREEENAMATAAAATAIREETLSSPSKRRKGSHIIVAPQPKTSFIFNGSGGRDEPDNSENADKKKKRASSPSSSSSSSSSLPSPPAGRGRSPPPPPPNRGAVYRPQQSHDDDISLPRSVPYYEVPAPQAYPPVTSSSSNHGLRRVPIATSSTAAMLPPIPQSSPSESLEDRQSRSRTPYSQVERTVLTTTLTSRKASSTTSRSMLV